MSEVGVQRFWIFLPIGHAAVHAVHVDDPVELVKLAPLVHQMQSVVEPAMAEYFPNGHREQTVTPEAMLYLPGLQAVQFEEPGAEV